MINFLWFALGWVSALLIVCTAAGLPSLPRRNGFDVSAEGSRLHRNLTGRPSGRNE